MANNYFEGTLNEFVFLSEALANAFCNAGADTDSAYENKNSITWSAESCFVECSKDRIENAEDSGIPITILDKLEFHELVRALFIINDDLRQLEVSWANYCSKLRLGEFGGWSVHVTRDNFCYIGTNSVDVIYGKLAIGTKVEKFKESFEKFKDRLIRKNVMNFI